MSHLLEPAPTFRARCSKGRASRLLLSPECASLVLCAVLVPCVRAPFPPAHPEEDVRGGVNQAPSVNVKGPCEARNQTESPMGDSATCPPAVIPCTTRKKLPTLHPHTPHALNPVEEARSNPGHFYMVLCPGASMVVICVARAIVR